MKEIKLKPCPFCKSKEWKIINPFTIEITHKEGCFLWNPFQNKSVTYLEYNDIAKWNREGRLKVNDKYYHKKYLEIREAILKTQNAEMQENAVVEILKQIARDQREATEKAVNLAIQTSGFWKTFITASLIGDIKVAVRTAEIEEG